MVCKWLFEKCNILSKYLLFRLTCLQYHYYNTPLFYYIVSLFIINIKVAENQIRSNIVLRNGGQCCNIVNR